MAALHPLVPTSTFIRGKLSCYNKKTKGRSGFNNIYFCLPFHISPKKNSPQGLGVSPPWSHRCFLSSSSISLMCEGGSVIILMCKGGSQLCPSSSWREGERNPRGGLSNQCLMSLIEKWPTFTQLTFYWKEECHMTKPTYKGSWEM